MVRAELLHGARKYVDPIAGWHWCNNHWAYVSLPFEGLAAERYAGIRHGLELKGEVIGPNDLLIAAI